MAFACEDAVSASADSENSDVAIKAMTLAFIEISFQCEKGRLRAKIRAETHVATLKGLDPQIVFEAENRCPELQPGG